jgi:hypothetical protein
MNICLPDRTGTRYSRDDGYDYHQRLDYLIERVIEGMPDSILEHNGASTRDIVTAREIVALRA